MKYLRCSRRRGFTLIELLVVIAIIAILAAILFPVFISAKDMGRRAKCASGLKQIDAALLMYLDDNGSRFAPCVEGSRLSDVLDWGKKLLTEANGPYPEDFLVPYTRSTAVWLCPTVNTHEIVPYLPGGADHRGDQVVRWSDNHGMVCLAAKRAISSYVFSHWCRGGMVSGRLVSERVVNATKAAVFKEMPYWGSRTNHSDKNGYGINIAFCDGHVKFMRTKATDVWGEWATEGWIN